MSLEGMERYIWLWAYLLALRGFGQRRYAACRSESSRPTVLRMRFTSRNQEIDLLNNNITVRNLQHSNELLYCFYEQ